VGKEAQALTVFVGHAQRARKEQDGRAIDKRAWQRSPWGWYVELPSTTRGAAGEKLAAELLVAAGFTVEPRVSVGHDLVVNGAKIEVKTSSLWSGCRYYGFSQLRDQDYDLLFLLGISPHMLHAWAVPKEVALRHAFRQHNGAAGQEVRWLKYIYPDQPPAWIAPYGGDLNAGLGKLAELVGVSRS